MVFKRCVSSMLQRKHHWSDSELEKLNVAVAQPKKNKGTGPGKKPLTKEDCDNCTIASRFVTQKDVNNAVDKLVIMERLPHRIVDSEHFKEVVLLGLPPNLKVTCRQTFRTRLEGHFAKMKNNLIDALSRVPFVATTADAWSKHRRGFLGMTVTWLDPDNMKRNFATLAMRRLTGSHTHARLGKAMHSVLEDFALVVSKVTRCTTDSASNFRKAFKTFQVKEDKDDPTSGTI